MKFAKKMRLVPADEVEKVVMVKPYEPLYAKNTIKTALEELGENMQQLLKSDASDEEKMTQYGQMMQRYQVLQNNLTKPSIIIPKLPETSTTTPTKPDILSTVPKTFQTRAKLLLRHLEEKTPFSWNDKLELTQKGQPVPGTNVVDIVNDLIRKRKTNAPPLGWESVMRSLKETNVPREAIGNDERWEVFSTPLTPMPSTVRTKKMKMKKMPEETPYGRRPKKWLTFDSL